MAKVEIDSRLCKGCRLCIAFCPRHSLHLAEEVNERGVRVAMVCDDPQCNGCGNCAVVCPDAAISICEPAEA